MGLCHHDGCRGFCLHHLPRVFVYTGSQKNEIHRDGHLLIECILGNIFVTGVNIFIQTEAPSFEATVPGKYVFELTGKDSAHSISDKVTIQVYAKGDLPEQEEIDAPPQMLTVDPIKAARPGESVTIFAQNLIEDYKNAPSFEWFSDNTALQIEAQDTPYAVVQSKAEGEYPLGVKMSIDGQTVVKYSTVIITKRNWPPLVNAGADQQVELGTVTLDGSDLQDLFKEEVA